MPGPPTSTTRRSWHRCGASWRTAGFSPCPAPSFRPLPQPVRSWSPTLLEPLPRA
jgi:hypothetical protein